MATKKQTKEIQLGNRVTDIVTGFTGIASSKIEYLNGCVLFGVKPKVEKDGKMPEIYYIDVQQLEFVDEGVSIKKIDTGGDMDDAPNSGNSSFH